MFVEEKQTVVNRNFDLPSEINEEFDDISARAGGGKKWAAITAAILVLADLPQDEQVDLILAVANRKSVGGSCRDLLDLAADNKLRAAIENGLPSPIKLHSVLARKAAQKKDR